MCIIAYVFKIIKLKIHILPTKDNCDFLNEYRIDNAIRYFKFFILYINVFFKIYLFKRKKEFWACS
jgi:hypothetical protein